MALSSVIHTGTQTSTISSQHNAHGSHLVSVVAQFDFTRILQGYFTSTRAMIKSAPVPLKQPCRLWVNSQQKVTPKVHQELWHNHNKTKQNKTMYTLYGIYSINSLWSSATWQHRFGSTLVHVMACCLTATSHYLDQCWLLIREVLWLSPESNFKGTAKATFRYNKSENYTFKITVICPRGQWVNTNAEKWHQSKGNHQLKGLNTLRPHEIANILQTFLNAFPRDKFSVFWFKFHKFFVSQGLIENSSA